MALDGIRGVCAYRDDVIVMGDTRAEYSDNWGALRSAQGKRRLSSVSGRL